VPVFVVWANRVPAGRHINRIAAVAKKENFLI